MLRIVSAFVVLFGAAVAFITLMPSPEHHGLPVPGPAHADAVDASPAAVRAEKAVRVVYAPSDGTAAVSPPVAATPEPPAPASPSPVIAPATAAPLATPPASAKVDINSASAEALDNIAGAGRIGRTIVQHRPYRSVEDLVGKRVIRKSVYDRIKDQVASQ